MVEDKMKRRKLGIQIREPRFFPKTEVIDTIINIPLHPKTGELMWKKAEVEECKVVRKGQHMFYQVLLQKNEGHGDQLYRRIVIA